MEFLGAMAPMAVFLAVGYILRKTGIADENAKNFLNKYLYYFAMPGLAFRSIASFDFKEAFVPGLVMQNLFTTFLVFIIMLGAVHLIKDASKRGSAHMAVYRSNQGYIGMYAVRSMYGELALSKSAVASGFDFPFVNILAVTGMELLRKRGEGGGFLKSAGRVMLKVITNPFVIAVALGMLESAVKTNVLGITAIDRTLELAGATALPLALVLVGASITFRYLKENIGLVAMLSAAKLILVPLAAYLSGVLLFRLGSADLSIGVTLMAAPSAVSGYVFAREMGGDQELMASCIGFSTVLSIATLPVVNILLNL
ncbi:MAG: AEC family transporter [Clostridia bacterium]|nr:AEC family transporter [Clostridia bacterium]